MTTSDNDDSRRPGHEMFGSAEEVVQAHDVHGGVHIHSGYEPRSTSLPPRQLPADVRDFVNRAGDLESLDLILAEQHETSAPVCVIVGTAGVGKTSLAVHWAHRVADQFPDGQLYANLHGYDPGPPVTAQQALDRFLRALDVPAASIPPDLEDRAALFRSLLAGRRMLVVLDNAASAGQVRPLLPGTAGCLVLVTSRSRLSGLVARDGAYRVGLDVLTEPEAIELLRRVTDRFRQADAAGDLTELARLCARLPLALRIAAERAGNRPHVPMSDLIGELRDESALWDALTAGHDDADAVRTVFAWSYRALSPDASRLFRLMGLHPGPDFSTGAASALAGADPTRVRRLLDDLVDAHLLEQVTAERYQFHDLLRAYAIDQVRAEEDPGPRAEATRRTYLWYLHSAAAALTATQPPGQGVDIPETGEITPARFTSNTEADEWFDLENANLVATVRAAAAAELYDIAWMLPAVLRAPHARRNLFDAWTETATIGLNAARALENRAAEAEMLASLGKANVQSNELAEGVELHQAALRIRQELGDTAGMLDSTNAIGLASLRAHRLAEASGSFDQARELAATLEDPYWSGVVSNNVAYVHLELERFDEAERLLDDALATFRRLGAPAGEGEALHGLSQARRGLGRPADALEAVRRALTIAEENRYRTAEALWLVELGRVEEAADFHRLAAVTFRELGDRWHLAVALVNLGVALRGSGAVDEADAQLREADELAAAFDDPRALALRAAVERLRNRADPGRPSE